MVLQAIFLPGVDTFFFNSALFDLVLKWLFVIGFGMYVIFSFIVTRQIAIMRDTLITTFSPLFTVMGYLHLALSIGFFIFILVS